MQVSTKALARAQLCVVPLVCLTGCALFGLDGDDPDTYEAGSDGGGASNGANKVSCFGLPVLNLGVVESGYLEPNASDSQACGGYGDGNGDTSYTFTPSQAGTYRFSLASEFDSVFYLVLEACENQVGSHRSVYCTDDVGTSAVETFDAYLSVVGAPVLVVVDTYFSTGSGDFALQVELIEAASSGTCGWDPGSSYYDCGFEGSDPSGANPMQCPSELEVGEPCGDVLGQGCCAANGDLWFCATGGTLHRVDCGL
jgi:hypothetical protein